MNIVLLQPEIPQNTGSIARTCAGTGTMLHLVGPLGFSLADRYLKRAGLDYWEHVRMEVHQDWDAFLHSQQPQPGALRLFSAGGKQRYDRVEYGQEDYLVFGGESKGFPEWFRAQYRDRLVRIPTNDRIRSLNLSNAANIVLYHALSSMNCLPG